MEYQRLLVATEPFLVERVIVAFRAVMRFRSELVQAPVKLRRVARVVEQILFGSGGMSLLERHHHIICHIMMVTQLWRT